MKNHQAQHLFSPKDQNSHSTHVRARREQKGQVAIFVALIFQVLFVLFAMVINIGLLVHLKINLQNSVDLAAYYGASKQAEVLNAMAHVNYQIRQAWKLFTWRYQIIGTLTFNATPPEPVPFNPQSASATAGVGEIADPWQTYGLGCHAFVPFAPFDAPSFETYCKDLNAPGLRTSIQALPTLGSLDDSLGFVTLSASINAAVNAANLSIGQHCTRARWMNWYAMLRDYLSWKFDLVNRKRTFNFLANTLSEKDLDFKDIRGESARVGVYNTFYSNLSRESRVGLKKDPFNDIIFYNSFGNPGCGGHGDGVLTPPGWIKEIYIAPEILYAEGTCGGAVTVHDFQVRTFASLGYQTADQPSPGASLPTPDPANPIYATFYGQYQPYAHEPHATGDPQKLYKASLGFEKDPSCMGYVKVQASVSPNIAFSPFSSGAFHLTATAYAKPFGGRIGPTFSNKGYNQFDQTKVDQLVPDRVHETSSPPPYPVGGPPLQDYNRNLNYSRFPGDQEGLKSRGYVAAYEQAIWKLSPFLQTANQWDENWWQEVFDKPFGYGVVPDATGDVLAYDKTQASLIAPQLRDIEISAVAPDLFDATYYSIEPDFYKLYLVPLLRRQDLRSSKPTDFFPRGDIGARFDSTLVSNIQNDPNFVPPPGPSTNPHSAMNFGIKDQIAVANMLKGSGALSALNHWAATAAAVLTSWQAKDNYVYDTPDDTRFGKCSAYVPTTAGPIDATTGNCIQGGRTGYSVKLVDEGYLKNDATINNPPP